jgi:hypothetical protein
MSGPAANHCHAAQRAADHGHGKRRLARCPPPNPASCPGEPDFLCTSARYVAEVDPSATGEHRSAALGRCRHALAEVGGRL